MLFGTREQTITLFIRGRGSDHSAAEVRVYSSPETTIGPPDHSEYYQRDLLPSGIWGEDGFTELIASWRDLSRRLGSVATELCDVLNTVDVSSKSAPGWRIASAIRSASSTRLVRMCRAICQPTIIRENTSMMAEKKLRPSQLRR